MFQTMSIVSSLLWQRSTRKRIFKKWCFGEEEEAKEVRHFSKTMLVHPNVLNTYHFLTQFFAHNQTIQDVCTERNELNKNSIFITVWSSHLSSQKFVLHLIINITTLVYVSLSCTTGDTMLSLVYQHRVKPYYIQSLEFIAIMVGFDIETNTLCCVVYIWIGIEFFHFLT